MGLTEVLEHLLTFFDVIILFQFQLFWIGRDKILLLGDFVCNFEVVTILHELYKGLKLRTSCIFERVVKLDDLHFVVHEEALYLINFFEILLTFVKILEAFPILFFMVT